MPGDHELDRVPDLTHPLVLWEDFKNKINRKNPNPLFFILGNSFLQNLNLKQKK